MAHPSLVEPVKNIFEKWGIDLEELEGIVKYSLGIQTNYWSKADLELLSENHKLSIERALEIKIHSKCLSKENKKIWLSDLSDESRALKFLEKINIIVPNHHSHRASVSRDFKSSGKTPAETYVVDGETYDDEGAAREAGWESSPRYLLRGGLYNKKWNLYKECINKLDENKIDDAWQIVLKILENE